MKKRIAVVATLVLGMLVVAATASAFKVHLVIGNLVLDAEGDFAPKALPKHENAPITTHGGGTLSTQTGELPPILDKFVLEFDKHGALDTTGLAVCTRGKLVATDVAAARRACGPRDRRRRLRQRGGEVPRTGTDQGRLADHPLQRPEEGRERHDHRPRPPRLPGPDDLHRPDRDRKNPPGVFGYRVNVKIPKIAGGYGHPISGEATVGQKWTYKGKKHSYINARCETGHFVVHGEFSFKGGPEETPPKRKQRRACSAPTSCCRAR